MNNNNLAMELIRLILIACFVILPVAPCTGAAELRPAPYGPPVLNGYIAEPVIREASGMAALIGAGIGEAESLCAARRADGGRLWVANLNAPGQVVVAGGSEDVEWAVGAAGGHGIRRVVPLKVAGAFHSPFMAPAAEELAAAVGAVEPGRPAFPVWANATAAPHGDDVGAALVAQLTAPVRFLETLAGMAALGIRRFVHVGPGDVTAGLARRSVEGAEVLAVSSLADLDGAAAAIEQAERGTE